MSLRETAGADATRILEDGTYGFGWPIILADPSGLEFEITGYTNDIHELIDPDTGVSVSGRRASIALSISTLKSANIALPYNVPDENDKPYVIKFNDSAGNEHVFKVMESHPDRTLNIVTCLLGKYEPC
ncbi:hypothetical protein KAR91_08305 [Candidatus Pacearchaeota archaeon]|nr:hypothetical protein [Candidatus Pacearchaeota archaeon]